MTAEEILRAQFCPYEWDEFMSNLGVDITPSIVNSIHKFTKHKLDEAIQLGYYMSCDDDEKVVDVMDLIEIKNKI